MSPDAALRPRGRAASCCTTCRTSVKRKGLAEVRPRAEAGRALPGGGLRGDEPVRVHRAPAVDVRATATARPSLDGAGAGDGRRRGSRRWRRASRSTARWRTCGGRRPRMIALISVYDKAGVRELALNLAELGFDIYSTGGTQRHLGGGRPARPLRLRAHRLPGDTGRPREDAPPHGARRHPRPARPARPHGGAGPQRDPAHRPRLREPLPVRGDRLEAGRNAGRGAGEHRHRRPDDAARRRQELPRRPRPRRPGGLRRDAGPAAHGGRSPGVPPPPGREGVPARRLLRHRRRPVPAGRRSAVPRPDDDRPHEGARPALRGEPAPAGRALPRGARRGRRQRHRRRREAARAGALVHQRHGRGRRLGGGAGVRRSRR